MTILKKKPREILKTMTLDMGGGETASVYICKPTLGDRVRLSELSRLSGDTDKDGNPVNEFASARIGARAMILLVETLERAPAFDAGDVEALLDTPFYLPLMVELGPALQGKTDPQA